MRRAAVALLALGCAAAPAWAQSLDAGCGNPFVNGFGPHDYRVETGHNRKIVEDYHFTPNIETLIRGNSAPLGGELDYTLRAFPNHHRALIAMMRLGKRLKDAKPPGAQFAVECYFKRALVFRPDDTVARLIYANYLSGNGRKSDATRELETVVRQAPDNAFTQYNVGLIYFELGEFDRALAQAHRAQGMGFERQDLKDQLVAAGKWADPVPAATADAASAAAPATAASAPTRP